MDLLRTLDDLIEGRSLLTHPFYVRWTEGRLPPQALRRYAREYYAFESAFPRVLSALHTRCDSAEARRVLLENLWDEEHGAENHAELWLRFAEAVGNDREAIVTSERLPATRALVHTYRRMTVEEPVAAGVAAVYAYERQVPGVAVAKIEGLRRHYGVREPRHLAFFEVHRTLDVEHADAERRVLAELAAGDEDAVLAAASDALEAWWGFLDGVEALEVAGERAADGAGSRA